jgi:hypothetical protein
MKQPLIHRFHKIFKSQFRQLFNHRHRWEWGNDLKDLAGLKDGTCAHYGREWPGYDRRQNSYMDTIL